MYVSFTVDVLSSENPFSHPCTFNRIAVRPYDVTPVVFVFSQSTSTSSISNPPIGTRSSRLMPYVSVQLIFVFLMVTCAAFTTTQPWMSLLLITVPALVTVMTPSTRVNLVPGGTPVLVASGIPQLLGTGPQFGRFGMVLPVTGRA